MQGGLSWFAPFAAVKIPALFSEAIEMERECFRRYGFSKSRLGHAPVGLQGMDLTQFMHGSPAKLMACMSCGTLHRGQEQPATYESDRYDGALLRHLYPRYLREFERKRRNYQPLLRPHAEGWRLAATQAPFLRRLKPGAGSRSDRYRRGNQRIRAPPGSDREETCSGGLYSAPPVARCRLHLELFRTVGRSPAESQRGTPAFEPTWDCRFAGTEWRFLPSTQRQRRTLAPDPGLQQPVGLSVSKWIQPGLIETALAVSGLRADRNIRYKSAYAAVPGDELTDARRMAKAGDRGGTCYTEGKSLDRGRGTALAAE